MTPIDQRLLSVFDDIYKSRSVTGAASALDLSQPAVSVALSKLWHHFVDPLFNQALVCMVSAQHPRIREQLTREQFEAEDHAVITSSGSAPLVIEQILAHQGVRRNIAELLTTK